MVLLWISGVMKATLVKANGTSLRAHWLLQEEKYVILCVKLKKSV